MQKLHVEKNFFQAAESNVYSINSSKHPSPDLCSNAFCAICQEVLRQQNFNPPQQDASRYTSELMRATLRRVYQSVQPCLFENHKPLFPALLALQSLEFKGAATQEEVQQLLAPAVVPCGKAKKVEELPAEAAGYSGTVESQWPPAGAREKLQGLQQLGEPFISLVASVLEASGDWEAALFEENPLIGEWPDLWNQRLSLLQQTLLVQCLRPECLRNCLQHLAEVELGSFIGEMIPWGLAEALDAAGPHAPLLILLAPGADPQAALLQLAEATNMHNKFVSVAMGKGQGLKAASG